LAFVVQPPRFKEHGDLLGAMPKSSKHLPYGTHFTKGAVRIPKDANFEFVPEASKKASEGAGYASVTYRYVDPGGQFRMDKEFRVKPSSPYSLVMKVTVENLRETGAIVDSLAVDLYGYDDPEEKSGWMNFRPNGINGSCYTSQGLYRSSFSGIEEALSYDDSGIQWGAIDTRYFTLTDVPLGEDSEIETCSIQKVDGQYLRTRLETDDLTIPAGSSKSYEHLMYMGPKHIDVLEKVAGELPSKTYLSSAVDYGLFSFLARPLRVALNWIQHYVLNWGLAIIILTILIKLLTWPINMKAYRSMEGMKEIQPKLQEIRDKYEDDRQKMTEKSMELFQEHDVSPMGGCLPMLVQMPFLYALYVMIYYSAELYHADFILWYTNLSAPDPTYALPILMGAVMFVQQGMMSQAAQANPQAKIMTKVMPVMFTVFMVFLPSGLVLYYSINLMIGIGQQLYVRHYSDTGVVVEEG
jgi:YidC/Oxa1 family membrane protein insertase